VCFVFKQKVQNVDFVLQECFRKVSLLNKVKGNHEAKEWIAKISENPPILLGAGPVLQLWGRPHGELPGLREMERGEGSSCKAGA
jgi:hypothetical protein